ncbi:MAG: hypothetical protein Q9167_001052 [Letrouitia subvulpina]
MSFDALKSISLSVPTLDKPFGVQLWPYFSQAFGSVMGYRPEDFTFVPGQTPMSTFQATATTLITYYVSVFAGRELMKNRSSMKLNGLFMLNYLTKYVELIDTVFLVLKKKPLTFLHTYHHGATALLCYTQLIGLTAVSWVPITLNLLVHVVMYWYYFQSARGVRIWWKEWITRLQIAQFVIDLGFVYFASYTYFSSTYFPRLPTAGRCAGEEFAAFAGIGILSSYLLLFISFYFATYKKQASAKGRNRSMSEMGKRAAIDMSKLEVPMVDEAIHGGTTGAAVNGSVVVGENGSAVNGSVKRGTRSRKA